MRVSNFPCNRLQRYWQPNSQQPTENIPKKTNAKTNKSIAIVNTPLCSTLASYHRWLLTTSYDSRALLTTVVVWGQSHTEGRINIWTYYLSRISPQGTARYLPRGRLGQDQIGYLLRGRLGQDRIQQRNQRMRTTSAMSSNVGDDEGQLLYSIPQ